ncbi:MAG: oligosaccharide flippase family protein, partial [Odoribacter sp.]|nr:oligosaccharide flippase family protein [Odoribacter sp.]
MGVIIRQSIKATIFNYIGAFIGFLTIFFVLTKYVEPEIIGLTKVMYEVAALIAGFAQLGTSASAMRFFPYFKNPENNHNGFFFYLLLMPAIGSVIFISLFLLCKNYIIDFFIQKSALIVEYYNWILPLTLFLVFWGVLETFSNILLRIVVPKFIREVVLRCILLVLYALYAFGWMSLDMLVAGYVLCYGLVMVFTLLYVSHVTPLSLKHDISFIDKKLLKKISGYTLFLLIGALGSSITGQLDLFMVSSQMGLGYAGIYTIAFYMATVIEMPSRSITAIASPLAAAFLKDGKFEEANQLYKKVALHQLMAGGTFFVLIWINIDSIFAIIPNGDVYSSGKWVVFFIAMAKLIGMTFGFGETLISFSRYYYWRLYFTFFITVLTILSNYWLIPILGMSGAAIATLLTYVMSYSVQQWIVVRKVKGDPYSWGIVKLLCLFMF